MSRLCPISPLPPPPWASSSSYGVLYSKICLATLAKMLCSCSVCLRAVSRFSHLWLSPHPALRRLPLPFVAHVHSPFFKPLSASCRASSSLSNVKAIVPDAPLHVFTSEPPVPGHAAFPVLARAPRTSQSVTRLTAPSSKPHYWVGEAPGTG
ncbi:hypothetical protein C8J57DRAFT_1710666 [Mycena rebaudengoi]|nr:hypothetical protein C8J57DRAFT_1710666 [Mycena rebaudengoi]